MPFSHVVMQSLMVGSLAFGIVSTAQASKRNLPEAQEARVSPKEDTGKSVTSPQPMATPSISYPELFKIFKETPDQIKQDPILQDALVDYKYKGISFLKISQIFKVIPLPSVKEKAVQDYRYTFLVTFALQEEPSLDPGGLSESVLQFIQSQAAQKNPEAENLLGVVYGEGLLKVPQDWAKAVQFFQAAADQGVASAQYTLGGYYAKGLGVPQDWPKAFQYYQAAANQGFAMAQNDLGWFYQKGQGVEKDLAKAVQYYQAAADQGVAIAKASLGWCYQNGKGVPQDLTKAVQYYQAAADQGLDMAQYNLGVSYATGQGVEKDLAKAVQYYQAASDQGFAIAQHNLGLCYATGQGVEKDLAKAGWLYLQAAQQNNLSAKKALQTLLAILPVDPPLAPLLPYKISEELNTAYESIMAPLSLLEVQNNPTSGDQKIARFAVKPTYETAQTLSQMLQEIYKAIENQEFWNDMGTLLLTSPQQGSPQDPDWKDAYVCLNNAWYCTLNPATQNIAKTIESFYVCTGLEEIIESTWKAKTDFLAKMIGVQASASVLSQESPDLEKLGQKPDLLTKTYDKLSKDLETLQDCQANFDKFREKLVEEIQTTASIRGRKLWEILQENPNSPA